MNSTELENRLIDFSVLIIEITNDLANGKAGNHLLGQIIRSGTSPSLNYREAQKCRVKKGFYS